VFRIFDAMNDMRNLKTAVDQTVKLGQHAQGTISYTVSPVHTLKTWVDMAKAQALVIIKFWSLRL
jgi:oxaloacetate decarboxylase alpha subunit